MVADVDLTVKSMCIRKNINVNDSMKSRRNFLRNGHLNIL